MFCACEAINPFVDDVSTDQDSRAFEEFSGDSVVNETTLSPLFQANTLPAAQSCTDVRARKTNFDTYFPCTLLR
jgi:hypothetical protein